MATDDDDKRVKDVLGEASMADLQRWFTLPSFTQLEEEGKAAAVPEDDRRKEARERYERAIAAVEPWFLRAIERRHELFSNPALQFEAVIDVNIDPDMPLFDAAMAATWATAEPREHERPIEMEDDLNECTPQALLRDLHRVESYFDIRYEVYDSEAQQRFNVVREVAEAMATPVKLALETELPGTNLKGLLAETLEERSLPWSELPRRYHMTNRRIEE